MPKRVGASSRSEFATHICGSSSPGRRHLPNIWVDRCGSAGWTVKSARRTDQGTPVEALGTSQGGRDNSSDWATLSCRVRSAVQRSHVLRSTSVGLRYDLLPLERVFACTNRVSSRLPSAKCIDSRRKCLDEHGRKDPTV